MSNSATPWMAALQAFLTCTISQNLLKFKSIELVMLSNHLTLCHPLLILLLTFPIIKVFSSELTLHIRWPKCWSFSYSASVFLMNVQGRFPLRLTGLKKYFPLLMVLHQGTSWCTPFSLELGIPHVLLRIFEWVPSDFGV